VVEVDADPQSGTFGQALAFIPLPGAPEGIAVAPSGQRAYVTDQTAGVVEELDVDVTSALYRHVLREIPVPNAILAGGIAIDPRRGRLQVLDVTQSAPRLVANVATGSAPVAVGVSGGGTDVAVANFAGRTIGFYHVVSTATPVRATPPIAMPGDAVAVAVTGGTLP